MKRAIALAAAAVALAACTQGSPAGGDLPANQMSKKDVDRTVFENFEDFPNVVVWCDGTTRVYTTQRDKAPLILVLNDRQCGGEGPSAVVQPGRTDG